MVQPRRTVEAIWIEYFTGKDVIRISKEDFNVEEIAPSAQGMVVVVYKDKTTKTITSDRMTIHSKIIEKDVTPVERDYEWQS